MRGRGCRSLYELVMHLKLNYAEATNMLAYHLIERGLVCLSAEEYVW